ncbi:MAG: hypothetical protein ACRCW3_01830 [Metamycoplasmataceae bacterium]
MEEGIRKVPERHATHKDPMGPTGQNKEFGGRNNGKSMEYLKEATVVLDLLGKKDISAEKIIKAMLERVGPGNLLAVRPKHALEYELTLRSVDDCEGLLEGVEIDGQFCEVRRLERREYIVSFLHLPAYVHDKTIEDKLRSWGVTPMTKVRRRLYPGTNVADGTRYVKVHFPKEITSLPYSTKFETSDGVQYFRVIHDGQVKLCRMCFQPGHFFKDCPKFTCFECCEQGHYAKDCRAEKCLDCSKVLLKCECEKEREDYQSGEETGTVEAGSSRMDLESINTEEGESLIPKDAEKESEQNNETVKETRDFNKADQNRLNEKEMDVCLEAVVSKEIEKEPLCNVKVDEMEYENEVKKGNEESCKIVCSVPCFDDVGSKETKKELLEKVNVDEMEEEEEITSEDKENSKVAKGQDKELFAEKDGGFGEKKETEKKEEEETRDFNKVDQNRLNEKEMNVCLDAVGSKEIEKELLCNVKVDEMEYEKEIKKGDEDNCKSVKEQDENVFSKRSKGKENGGKKQGKVHHVLRYKKIPNLNLVLKKQKKRRSDVKKNKEIVDMQLRTEFGWSALLE